MRYVFILLCSSTLAFSQTRTETLVNVQHISGGTPAEMRFFDENLRMEINGAGFTLALGPTEADYIVEYSIVAEDPGRVLVCTLVNARLGIRMITQELFYLEKEDAYELLPYIIWIMLANAPLTRTLP